MVHSPRSLVRVHDLFSPKNLVNPVTGRRGRGDSGGSAVTELLGVRCLGLVGVEGTDGGAARADRGVDGVLPDGESP